MTADNTRPQTAIDRIAEDWVDTLAQLDPLTGTYIGRTEVNGRIGDLSPAGLAENRAAAARTLAALRAEAPADAVDEITLADLSSSLELEIEIHDAGLPLRDLNVLESAPQRIRDAFDLMPTATEGDWSQIAERLRAVPEALAQFTETLREGARRGITPARRQVIEVAAQATRQSTEEGFFRSFAREAALLGEGEGAPAGGAPLPESLGRDTAEAAAAAAAAYRELGLFLTGELAPVATERDAIGRENYALFSRKFLGATIDLDETYEWGREELARMVSEQESIAREILPGASVLEAIAHLDADPSRKLHGTDALQRWMQETSDRAVEELGRTHFDIPQQIRRLECMIAPTQEGAIYYTGPSDDLSRPGRMWWSVPEGITEFDTWRELTTVYHEGVPGHHLQIAQAALNRGSLNTWRRQLAGTSGHAEGWALYAERLMEQLGYLDDPADRLGMLDGQRMRAARVVLDIGVHLEKERPGGGVWDAEYAHGFLAENVNMNDGFVNFELNRYLGWPGQAPSYKVGQRIWEQVRDEYAARAGAGFDIRDFHRDALDMGVVGLDTMRAALLGR